MAIGTEAGQTTAFNISSIDTDALGLTTGAIVSGAPVDVFQATASGVMTLSASVAPISVLSATAAASALTKISTAIEQVASNRAGYGALSNRLEYTASNLMNVAEFTTQARSRIEDADFAKVTGELTKSQIMSQAATAMLAQANASKQGVLSLLQG